MSVLETSKNQGQKSELFYFTQGIAEDRRLFRQEIQVQKEWSRALGSLGVISDKELASVLTTLDLAYRQMEQGIFDWKIEDEDIHMNLERFLVEKIGEVGKKIHCGRSRNDLIATTLRLYVRDALSDLQSSVVLLIRVLCDQAEKTVEILVPGMTHLQHGQPIRFGHILAAHGWAFARDLERLIETQRRAMAVMPLGSAALAGTPLKIDLNQMAVALGFQSAPYNSYDSVGDRDFLMDGLHMISMLGVHLSRIAEDLIFWSSTATRLVQLPRRWSTGSSVMPNKRNPDVPELIRAKSSSLISASLNAQVLMKGLPTSYNSDLHELKRIFNSAWDEAQKCLTILGSFLSEIEVDRKQAQALLNYGNLLATEVAHALTLKGLSFREAYRQAAAWVEEAESQGISIEKLVPDLPQSSLAGFSFESAVEAREMPGGTALQAVLDGIQKLRIHLTQELGKKKPES